MRIKFKCSKFYQQIDYPHGRVARYQVHEYMKNKSVIPHLLVLMKMGNAESRFLVFSGFLFSQE